LSPVQATQFAPYPAIQLFQHAFDFRQPEVTHPPAQYQRTLIAGSYLPRAIRKVDIPKPNGDVRTLGIPTVVDRLIQQAIAQALCSGIVNLAT